MKKLISLMLAATLICTAFTGCGRTQLNGRGADTYDITVQGSIFGGAGDDSIRTEVSFDPAWITKKDNTKYNKDLAAFSAILSDDVYFRTKDVERGTPNRVLYDGETAEEYDWTNFLKHVGFSEVQYIESHKAKEYSADTNDSATMALAHGVADDKYDIYVAVLRGCFSVQEWISIFDPGFAGQSYTDLTGQHPEWTDENAFKGLDIAKNRAMEFIDEFMKKNGDPDLEDCILVTGHSRGGALANMIGAEMEDRENIRSYTYTFNAPGVTTDEKAAEYLTVFNVFDSNDFYVDPMPFEDEKFFRFGRDMSLSIADSDEIKSALTLLKGRDDFACMSAEAKAGYAELFGQRFPGRGSLYDMTTVTHIFDTEEAALAHAETCSALIGSENGLGLEDLCFIGDVQSSDGKYEVSMSYCGAAVLRAYAKTLAYGASAYEATVHLFEEDSDACRILDLLMENAAGLTGGHLLINSFVLTQYVKQR